MQLFNNLISLIIVELNLNLKIHYNVLCYNTLNTTIKEDIMLSIIKIPLQRRKKQPTKIDLVKASIKGDSDSFTELMKLHKVSLYKIAYSYVKDNNNYFFI